MGVGYVLGRTRKMKFALSLAGAAMSRRSTGLPSELLGRGSSLLRSSPELTQLTDEIRGELMGAVRTAAVTAASNRIDALNNRLQQGPALVSGVGAEESEPSETEPSGTEDEEFDATLEAEDSAGEEVEDAESGGERDEEAPRPAARPSRPRAARKTASPTTQRRSGSADRKSAAAPRRRARADADAAPVRRTRR
ncbi:hypothetical protein [Nocardia arizonensis]|uniref:hypothetical protein n=1 Tax=Nocardia arizonensis TaxID=1141647 RepID=UPI0006D26528|nr:hypothetical protein [Nocardia arizonensis]